MDKTLYNITKSGRAHFKDKGSKFESFAFAVDSDESVIDSINTIKTEYPGATHYCYAYIMGYNQEKSRANDDGEPSNSAGQPILRQLRSAKLTDALLIVVRYYGGVKLGVPGLIHAYGEAARLAIADAIVSPIEVFTVYSIKTPKELEHTVYQLLKKTQTAINTRIELNELVLFELRLNDEQEAKFLSIAASMHWLDIERLS